MSLEFDLDILGYMENPGAVIEAVGSVNADAVALPLKGHFAVYQQIGSLERQILGENVPVLHLEDAEIHHAVMLFIVHSGDSVISVTVALRTSDMFHALSPFRGSASYILSILLYHRILCKSRCGRIKYTRYIGYIMQKRKFIY